MGDAGDWRVGAEERDPPPAPLQRNGKDQQRDVVLLARRARQHRTGATSGPEPVSEGQEAGAQDVGREMFLGDRRLSVLPAGADIREVGQQNLGGDRLEGERSEESVERLLSQLAVERCQRAPERPGGRVGLRGCRAVRRFCEGRLPRGASPASAARAACAADRPSAMWACIV